MMQLEKCELCPRRCGVNRQIGHKGFCQAGIEVKIARVGLHHWEEPCLSGERGSGTVFFSHCTLRCVFCQNHQISTGGKGKIYNIEELAEGFVALQRQGAHNINLVTPTHYVPQIIEALKQARTKGLTIPIVYNSSGYETVDTLKLLEGWIDIYLPDFKYIKEKYAKAYSHAPGYAECAKAAIAEMVRQVGEVSFDEEGMMTKGVIVRHLILPGQMFDSKKIIEYLHRTYNNQIYMSLMNQYTPLQIVKDYPRLNQYLNPKHYEYLVDYAVHLGIENAFIQEGETASESFIPPFEE
ncbi:MAG: radical SAM protein [Cellulosilyticaceae bacterium]